MARYSFDMPGAFNDANFQSSAKTDNQNQQSNPQQDHTCACRTSPRAGKFTTLERFRSCNKHETPSTDQYRNTQVAPLEPGCIVHVRDECYGSRVHNRVMLLLKKNGYSETWQAVSFCIHDPVEIGREVRKVHRSIRYPTEGSASRSDNVVDIDLLCETCQLKSNVMINIQELWLLETGGSYYKVGEISTEMFAHLRRQICQQFSQDMQCNEPDVGALEEVLVISSSPVSVKDVQPPQDVGRRKSSANRKTAKPRRLF